MTNTTITRTRAPKVTIPTDLDTTVVVPVKTPRVTLKQDVLTTAATLKEKSLRVKRYTRKPATNTVGEPLPMPLRFSIALNTATKKHAAAVEAYDRRYGKGKAKALLAAAK